MFDPHEEGDHVAVGAAAEAIEALSPRIHHEGRRAVLMERASRDKALPART